MVEPPPRVNRRGSLGPSTRAPSPQEKLCLTFQNTLSSFGARSGGKFASYTHSTLRKRRSVPAAFRSQLSPLRLAAGAIEREPWARWR